jgi:hypothetical protein
MRWTVHVASMGTAKCKKKKYGWETEGKGLLGRLTSK